MDQKTIKLWEEYKKEIEERNNEFKPILFDFLEKLGTELGDAKRFKVDLSFEKITLSGIDLDLMGYCERVIRAKVENMKEVPTFEGFMDWLSNRLTKKNEQKSH